MLRTNFDRVPMISVSGAIVHPSCAIVGKRDLDGQLDYLVGTGGITYNARIGDPAVGWSADHLEPGVSVKNPNESHNAALTTYSCVGNTVKVITGEAKGDTGFVVGTHGGCEHLIVYFPRATIEKLEIEDKVRVLAQGKGLKLTDYPDIYLRGVSKDLLDRMNITEKDGKLHVGVAKIVPGSIMGSGIGWGTAGNSDYDITLFSERIVKEYGLDGLRFGDIVAIMDSDSRFGRTFLEGAVTIGVIVHSDCVSPGHGPGVTTLLACKTDNIVPFIDENANLATLYQIEE